MKLTKENYEFLMFELLEGNLNETEKEGLLKQIQTNDLYKKEWALMQSAVAFPDDEIVFEDKAGLLKSERKALLIFNFKTISGIAASFLILATIIWFFNRPTPAFVKVVNKPLNSNESVKPFESDLPNKKSNEFVKSATQTEPYRKLKVKRAYSKPVETNISDSLGPANLNEAIIMVPVETDQIAYNMSMDEVKQVNNLQINTPVIKNAKKKENLFAKAGQLAMTTRIILKDLPNLTIKVNPKLKDKNKSIGFEIKGEVIYANALIEIK